MEVLLVMLLIIVIGRRWWCSKGEERRRQEGTKEEGRGGGRWCPYSDSNSHRVGRELPPRPVVTIPLLRRWNQRR